jgi:outer membrane protein OmpA-like peptidoglycan-associated protein
MITSTRTGAVVGRVQNGSASGASVKNSSSGGVAKPQRQLIVGEVADEEEEDSKTRDAKERKKLAKKERQKEEARKAKEAEEANKAKHNFAADAYSMDPIAIEKRIKKLKTKLRQIDQLKAKV